MLPGREHLKRRGTPPDGRSGPISARPHADRAVKAHVFAVHVIVLDQEQRQRRIFGGRTQPLGKGNVRGERGLRLSGRPFIIGVSKIPGRMVLTRTPSSIKSRAIGRVMPTTPAFDAA